MFSGPVSLSVVGRHGLRQVRQRMGSMEALKIQHIETEPEAPDRYRCFLSAN